MKVNHKYLSIVLLFLLLIVLFMKNKENFTEDERKNALDNIKTQNDLFKSVFNKITDKDVKLGKTMTDVVLTNPVVSGIKLSNKWSGYPDKVKNQSEISNDINTYKALMIVGNKSAGSNRKVRVWDHLRVHGRLDTDDKITAKKEFCIDGVCINKEHLKALKGERSVFIKSTRVNKYLQSGDFTTNVKGSDHSHNLRNAAEFDGGGKGHWEGMRIEL